MAGRRFGPYELEELLGRGGMGEVWRATDTRKSRTVALKLLPSDVTDAPDVEERFRREAQVAARLNDPHVIPIHDYGELHGRLYLDMRLVEGVDLAKTLRESGALDPRRAVSIISQVADALDAAHDDGLIHRDVKPSNILLTTQRRGSDDFVYLIDFGIAAGSMLGTRLTATGHAIGTAAYMAPERFTEDRDADRRVDVYALGCVLYEMLTGSTPFEGTSLPNLMYQHLNTRPPRPSAKGPLPRGFDAVVAKAMSKMPEQRYARAGDLAEAARAALEAPGPSRPTPAPPKPPAPPQPTRVQPPPTEVEERDSAPRWNMAPPPPAGRAGPLPAGQPASGNSTWRKVAAITAIVLHSPWLVISLVGTPLTMSRCSTSTSACFGGVTGLFAIAAGIAGIVLAALALRQPGRWRLVLTWVLLLVAFVLIGVTANLDVPTTR